MSEAPAATTVTLDGVLDALAAAWAQVPGLVEAATERAQQVASLALAALPHGSPPPAGWSEAELTLRTVTVLLLALVLDAVLGDPPWLLPAVPRPRRLVARLVDGVERRLNRPRLRTGARLARGCGLAAVALALAVSLGGAVAWASRTTAEGWTIELFVLWAAVSQRAPLQRLGALRRALSRGDAARAQALLVGFSRRAGEPLDGYAQARAGVETAARRFTQGVVSPVFWFAVAGPIGLCVQVVLDILAERLGFLDHRYEAFGFAVRRADQALAFFPARIAGTLVAFGCLVVPGARLGRAVATIGRQARHHRSQAAGWPIAALAGAFDLALAGPRRYPQEIVQEAWIGTGRARLSPVDITRCRLALAAAVLVHAAVVAGLAALLLAP